MSTFYSPLDCKFFVQKNDIIQIVNKYYWVCIIVTTYYVYVQGLKSPK